MLFFGWGRKLKIWKINEEMQLLLTWRYFHIFWCPISYNFEWHLIRDKRSEDVAISYEKVKELFPDSTPHVGLWHRYGLLLIIGGVVALNVIAYLIGGIIGLFK